MRISDHSDEKVEPWKTKTTVECTPLFPLIRKKGGIECTNTAALLLYSKSSLRVKKSLYIFIFISSSFLLLLQSVALSPMIIALNRAIGVVYYYYNATRAKNKK